MNGASDDRLTLTVRVVPRSSRSEIVGLELDGALKIKLASPPVDGAANDEMVRLVAKAFGVSNSSVEIAAGHTSRTKTLRIAGASAEKIAAILQPKS